MNTKSNCVICPPLPSLILVSVLCKIMAGGLLVFFLLSCTADETKKLSIGDQAPSFVLQDLEGNAIRLADFAGSPVVMRFILTDCKYCRADTPVFNDYYRKYENQGFGMLYIDSLGISRATLENFAENLAISFPILKDPGGRIAATYNVKAMPQTIILNPDHQIIGAILGGVSEAEMDLLLGPYLAEENGVPERNE